MGGSGFIGHLAFWAGTIASHHTTTVRLLQGDPTISWYLSSFLPWSEIWQGIARGLASCRCWESQKGRRSGKWYLFIPCWYYSSRIVAYPQIFGTECNLLTRCLIFRCKSECQRIVRELGILLCRHLLCIFYQGSRIILWSHSLPASHNPLCSQKRCPSSSPYEHSNWHAAPPNLWGHALPPFFCCGSLCRHLRAP